MIQVDPTKFILQITLLLVIDTIVTSIEQTETSTATVPSPADRNDEYSTKSTDITSPGPPAKVVKEDKKVDGATSSTKDARESTDKSTSKATSTATIINPSPLTDTPNTNTSIKTVASARPEPTSPQIFQSATIPNSTAIATNSNSTAGSASETSVLPIIIISASVVGALVLIVVVVLIIWCVIRLKRKRKLKDEEQQQSDDKTQHSKLSKFSQGEQKSPSGSDSMSKSKTNSENDDEKTALEDDETQMSTESITSESPTEKENDKLKTAKPLPPQQIQPEPENLTKSSTEHEQTKTDKPRSANSRGLVFVDENSVIEFIPTP